jgi:acetyl esterase/lipase
MKQSPVAAIILSLFLGATLCAQREPRGGMPVPEGVKALRDLVYVPDGHERHKLDLYLPEKAEGPLPLIIWIHGGGWQNGGKENCLPLRVGCVSRGYALASINYRLSGHAPFPAQIEDCKAAIRWLRAHAKEHNLDPQRFGVWGSSAGGHLAALVGASGDVKEFDVGANTDQSSRVQAVCDFFGPTDFTVFVTTPGYESHAMDSSPESKLIGGAVLENKYKAACVNPITYVSGDDPPFLIVHGDKDPIVPNNQSWLLFDELKLEGVSARFHTIQGAGHGGPGFAAKDIDEMVFRFFEERLKGTRAGVDALVTSSVADPAAMARDSRSPRQGGRREVPAGARPPLEKPEAGFRRDGERWTHREGDLVTGGILLMPEGKGPFPAVLISHGMGGSAGSFGLQKAREMVGWGFVCIAPDYTHSAAAGGARGRTPNPDAGASAENIRRAKVCLDILRGLPEADPKRLFAYGHSMGGFVTIGLAADSPDALKAAAISGSGVARREGCPAPSESAAEKIRTPFLMLHGADDTTVRPEQSQSLERVLDKNQVANDRVVFEGQGHPVDQTKRAEVFRLVREWFSKQRE